MSMTEATVLVHMNKSFNPFRSVHNALSTSSAARPVLPAPSAPEQRQEHDDSHNDSWHTNPPYITIQPQTSKNRSPPTSPTNNNKSPVALSWFSGWTSIPKSKSPKSTKHIVPASAAATEDGHIAENSTNISHPAVNLSQLPLSSHLGPAISMTMNRGSTISPRQDGNSNYEVPKITLSSSPQNNGLGTSFAAVTGGCMAIPPTNGSRFPAARNTILQIQSSNNDGNDSTQIEIYDLPTYPDLDATHSYPIEPPPPRKRNEALVVQDDSSSPSAIVVGEKPTPVVASASTRREPSLQPSTITTTPDPMVENEDSTYPGFSLLQMATAQYCQGRYSQALDTTTECLAFQKSYFSHEGGSGGGGGNATPVSSKGMTKSMIEAGTVEKVLSTINSSTATPFDSRSSFAAQIGSSVLGVVRSLKSEVPSIKDQQASRQQHPMLSNTVSAMISQYPTKPCVVKTLLLRGHVLVACGLHEYDDDRSLIAQAIKSVEMAVAIQRKLAIDRELAASLIFLGVLKSRTGLFCEADTAYKEAICILREVRRISKSIQPKTSEMECSKEIAPCKKLDDEIAHTLYLHGKSLHCQRMYTQAFHYYNRAFKLCKRSGSSRNSASVKNIVRCMKKSCALEKLVSAYWDDATVI